MENAGELHYIFCGGVITLKAIATSKYIPEW